MHEEVQHWRSMYIEALSQGDLLQEVCAEGRDALRVEGVPDVQSPAECGERVTLSNDHSECCTDSEEEPMRGTMARTSFALRLQQWRGMTCMRL